MVSLVHSDFTVIPDRVGLMWMNDKVTDVYSAGFRFESQPGHTVL
jgi:hypothetical protein